MKMYLTPLCVLALMSFSGAWSAVEAKTISGAVYENGRIQLSSGFRLKQTTPDSCEDGLLFTFTETVEPGSLALSRRDSSAGSGTIELHLEIVSVCSSVIEGQASFEYRHRATNGGDIGSDLSIGGFQSSMLIGLLPGETASQTISYEAAGESPTDHTFVLEGDQISYSGGNEFGSGGGLRTLASISVAGTGYVDSSDPGVAGDPRLRDATTRLDEVCMAAEQGTDLAATCDAIAGMTGDNLAQVARAFDPHELAAMPGSANEATRIQAANVDSRLAALRSGAVGISLSGLRLSMNGNSFDTGLLPVSLMRNNDTDTPQLFGNRLGFFINGEISIGKRSRRGKEVGFDFDSWGLTSGVDYRFDNGTVIGAAIGFSSYEADLNQNGGSLETETWTSQIYGSFDLMENLYLDATIAYSSIDFDQQRVIDLSGLGVNLPRHIAHSSTSGEQWSTSLALNYRIVLDGGWQMTPYGQFRYSDTDIDGFSERSQSPFAVRMGGQNVTSRLLSAGVRISRPINLTRGVMVPYADLAFEHESDNDGYTMQPMLVDYPSLAGPAMEINNPDRNVGRLDLGSSWVFTNGTQVFVSYSTALFDRYTTRHSLFAGARWEF